MLLLLLLRLRVERLRSARVIGIVGIGLTASVFGARVLEPHLEDAFGEARLLRQLFEVLGVRVVVELEVGLHDAQLVMLERGAHAFLTLSGCAQRKTVTCDAHVII